MKLQRFNKYVATVMVSFVAITNISSVPMDIKEEVVIKENNFEEPTKVNIKFDIPSDEVIIEGVSELGDLDNDKYISKIYKVLEFADKNQYYKVMVVGARVDYILDDSGNVINNRYTVFDMFSKKDLFSTTDLDSFDNMIAINELFDSSRILSCGSIDKLGNIAKTMGASEEYIKVNMNNNQTISDSDAAMMYVSLIPSYCRVRSSELQYTEKTK